MHVNLSKFKFELKSGVVIWYVHPMLSVYKDTVFNQKW